VEHSYFPILNLSLCNADRRNSIEELTCLRLLWQDLRHFEQFRSAYVLNYTIDYPGMRSVDLFFDDFKSVYKSAIIRARHQLDRLRADHYRLAATALLTQISSAWQSFAKPDQSLDELEDLMRAYEIAGDSITALVLQELVLSKSLLNAYGTEATAASEHLLGLYDIFLDIVARVAPRLNLNVDTCISLAPILHRVVRLNHLQLFNAILRRGADLNLQDYLGRTVVHVAVECNAVLVLKEFPVSILEKQVFNLFLDSPLKLAIESKNILVIKHLLSVQPTWKRDNVEMRHLMTAAVRTGLAVVVQLLLAEGNFCSTEKDIWNIPLKAAAALGHLETVRLLLIAGAELNDTEASLYGSRRRKTALCHAAGNGHLEVVRHLLRFKADVSAYSTYSGMAPLHGAAYYGHYDIARILLQAGADANATCWVKRASMERVASALELASAQGHVLTLLLLVASSSTTNRALNAAARNGQLDAVNALIDAGADIEDTNCTGTTALLEAVSGGHLLVVSRLLQAKANVEASSRQVSFQRYFCCTPLHIAAGKGLVDIVQTLVDAGGNINAFNTPDKDIEATREYYEEYFDEEQYYHPDSDDLGYVRSVNVVKDYWEAADEELSHPPWCYNATVTPLLLAAGRGQTQTVQLLIRAGANVNAMPEGCYATALQAAASAGHLGTLQLLLEADGDVNAPARDPTGKTALQRAIRCGHAPIVHLLVNAHADVNAAASQHGATALQYAVAGGQLQVVQLLLGAGANVNARPQWLTCGTPLQIAARYGDVGIVQSLLQAEAVVNTIPRYRNGHTALQAAAERGHLEVVKLLLGAHADVNFIHANCVGSALQVATCRANVEVVRLLLGANANPNSTANHSSGMTPLQGAAKCGQVELVRLLLDAKADPNGSKYGLTPLQYATYGNHEDIFEQLLTAGANVNALPEGLLEDSLAGETALTIAVRVGNINMAKQLLSFGADINKRGRNKPSALEKASRGDTAGSTVEFVDLLLSAHADVNACSGFQGQSSPLGAAARSGHIAIAQKLLTANADVNLGNPLAGAAAHGFVNVVRLLLSKHADFNATEASVYSFGGPALVSAAQWGHLEVVEILLEAGTKLDFIESALSMAALRGYLEVVKALLRKRPDPNAVHATYRSPLWEAAANGYVEILRLLLLAGADPNAPTSLRRSEDCTPLEAAVSCGHPDAVRLLLLADADLNPPLSVFHGQKTLLQLAESRGFPEILQILEDADTSSLRNGSRKRKRKGKGLAVELDETSSSE